jgi:hypothetical protein
MNGGAGGIRQRAGCGVMRNPGACCSCPLFHVRAKTRRGCSGVSALDAFHMGFLQQLWLNLWESPVHSLFWTSVHASVHARGETCGATCGLAQSMQGGMLATRVQSVIPRAVRISRDHVDSAAHFSVWRSSVHVCVRCHDGDAYRSQADAFNIRTVAKWVNAALLVIASEPIFLPGVAGVRTASRALCYSMRGTPRASGSFCKWRLELFFKSRNELVKLRQFCSEHGVNRLNITNKVPLQPLLTPSQVRGSPRCM